MQIVRDDLHLPPGFVGDIDPGARIEQDLHDILLATRRRLKDRGSGQGKGGGGREGGKGRWEALLSNPVQEGGSRRRVVPAVSARQPTQCIATRSSSSLVLTQLGFDAIAAVTLSTCMGNRIQ